MWSFNAIAIAYSPISTIYCILMIITCSDLSCLQQYLYNFSSRMLYRHLKLLKAYYTYICSWWDGYTQQFRIFFVQCHLYYSITFKEKILIYMLYQLSNNTCIFHVTQSQMDKIKQTNQVIWIIKDEVIYLVYLYSPLFKCFVLDMRYFSKYQTQSLHS